MLYGFLFTGILVSAFSNLAQNTYANEVKENSSNAQVCYHIQKSDWGKFHLVPHAFLSVKMGQKFTKSLGYYPDGIRDDSRTERHKTHCEKIPKERESPCKIWITSAKRKDIANRNSAQEYRATAAYLVPFYSWLPESNSFSLSRLIAAVSKGTSTRKEDHYRAKGDPYFLWGNNCADFVKEGWQACTGKTLSSELKYLYSNLYPTDPEALRPAERPRP